MLLVILFITTPKMMNNLEMTLPLGKPPPKTNPAKSKIQRITIGKDGGVTLNDATASVPMLRERLASLKNADAGLSEVVNGADEADHQSVVTVLDITKVGLTTTISEY